MEYNKIALVGLPNAGKSTLFNKLCKRHLAISFDEDNTTVDYLSYTLGSKVLSDTCGINKIKDFEDISGQYILENDLILYVIDGRFPPTDMDREICKFLRKQKKTLWLICNKCESKTIKESQAKSIFYDRLFWTSSEHSLGIDELKAALGILESETKTSKNAKVLDNSEVLIKSESDSLPLIAILGRANSGKSSLINCFLGFDRVKVEDKIGTTRDNVICQSSTMYHEFNFMDTAGYRKDNNALEYITKKRRQNSLQYCDGVILVLDGNIGLTRIDKQILEEAAEYAKFIIICINKMDILHNNPKKDFKNFNVPEWIPVVEISAKNNRLGRLKEIIDACYGKIFTKIPTPELNNLLHSLDGSFRSEDNKRLKIKYIFQQSEDPIIIGYFALDPLSEDSSKFLIRKIAKKFDLFGVNLKLRHFKKKPLLNKK